MEPPSLPSPLWLQAALTAAAAALAERLRCGGVPKRERAAARAALTRAFELLERLEADPDSTPPGGHALLREVDTRATGPLRWPGVVPRIGLAPLKGAVDDTLVDRLWAHGEVAERISTRIDAFLEATGAQPLRLFVVEVRPGERESPEMAFTEG